MLGAMKESPLGKRRGVNPSINIDSSLPRLSTDSANSGGSTENLYLALSPTSPIHPAQILPFLYLGCEKHANSLAVLQENQISAILNVAAESERKDLGIDGIDYMHQRISDNFEEDIMKYFQTCFDFIEKSHNSGKNVLIHCTAGKSRSPTITMAYLIYSKKWTLRQAYEYVKERRKICPNLGFLCILAEFEKAVLGEERKGLTELCRSSLSDLSILVTDDDDHSLSQITQVLTRLGYQFDIARNGEEAIRKVIEKHYDLVLMDTDMPVMDGIEATKKIRELQEKGVLTSKLVIIALSSAESSEGLEVSGVMGIDAFLLKPLRTEQLEMALKNSLIQDGSAS